MRVPSKNRQGLIDELRQVTQRLAELEGADAERLQATTRLHQFETAVETTQLGVTITDLNGKILYSNPADAALHGYTADELVGEDLSIFAVPGNRKPMSTEQLDRWTSWHRESVNVRKDGTEFPVQLMSDVVRDDADQPIAVVTTCEDITVRKRAEEALKEQVEQAWRIAALERENRKLKTLLSPNRRRRVVLAVAWVVFVSVAAVIGSLIGRSPAEPEVGQPIPVPINPADTLLPPAEADAFYPPLPSQRPGSR